MRAVVNWFDYVKGYGILKTDDNREFFVHQTSILMEGFRFLEAGDIVDFKIGTTNTGQIQAFFVNPIITRQMIRNALKEKNLKIKKIKSRNKKRNLLPLMQMMKAVPFSWMKGMSLKELAAFAGIDLKETLS